MARKSDKPVPLNAPRDGTAVRIFPRGDIGSWIVTWDGGAGMWRWVGLTKLFTDDARFFGVGPV